MTDRRESDGRDSGEELCEQVAVKAARKARARREKERSVWFGLGMFGVVGWSVAMPTLIAVAIGVWIDGRWPSQYSWTLMLLFVGIVLGCLNAWYWVNRERSVIERRGEEEERDG